MPADPLQHVSPGTPLMEAVTAEVLNALKDAARDVRGERLPGPSGGASSKDLVGSLTVLIRNDTGGDLASGSILKITGKIGDVVNSPIPFRKRPVLTGDVPDDTQNPVAILHEPILTGGFGRAAIAGVAVCYVSINDAGHEYAAPIVGDETALESVAFGGPARIVWKESSGAVRVAVVILGDAAAGLDLIDISGRSGSVADVTAVQFARAVASGTSGATVVTPDDASETLPGDVNLSDQKLGMGRKTVEELGIGESAFGTTMRLYQYSAQVIRMQDSAGATQPRLTLPFGGSLQFRSIDDTVEATIFYDNTVGADCLFLTVNGSSAFKIAAPGTTPTSTSLPCVVGSQIIAAQFSADFDGTYAGRKPGATATVGGMEFAGGLYITGTPTASSIDGGTF